MSSETSRATTQHSERSYSAFLSGLAKEILQLSICAMVKRSRLKAEDFELKRHDDEYVAITVRSALIVELCCVESGGWAPAVGPHYRRGIQGRRQCSACHDAISQCGELFKSSTIEPDNSATSFGGSPLCEPHGLQKLKLIKMDTQ